ncbi:MAG: gltJ [Microvirga sp.]|jgi:glutamate/aspartate transport system permease protein|nr:gltJ [Microvirga sp.]
MHYNWNWGILVQQPYLGWLLAGVGLTLLISASAWIIAFVVGTLVGIARTSTNRALNLLGSGYVAVFRNIPLLVQMFLWFFVLPEILPRAAGDWLKRNLSNPQVWTAIVCLGFYTSVRIAEQVRAGLTAIGRGQLNAALSIGMTTTQALRHVLLPVVYRIQVPVLTSEALTIIKNSSVALTIGAFELTAQARRVEEYTFQGIEAFSAATVAYITLTTIVIVIMSVIERRSEMAL